jgi:hypothetical protein
MTAVAARVAAWLSRLVSSAWQQWPLTWESAGGAPGARTQNLRIKSPLLCH